MRLTTVHSTSFQAHFRERLSSFLSIRNIPIESEEIKSDSIRVSLSGITIYLYEDGSAEIESDQKLDRFLWIFPVKIDWRFETAQYEQQQLEREFFDGLTKALELQLEQASRKFGQTLSSVKGEICWSVLASATTGLALHLKFGKQRRRQRALKNPNLTETERKFDGEITLYTACPWRIKSLNGILIDGDDEQGYGSNGPTLKALEGLKGKKITRAECAPASHNLSIEFDGEISLEIYDVISAKQNFIYTFTIGDRVFHASGSQLSYSRAPRRWKLKAVWLLASISIGISLWPRGTGPVYELTGVMMVTIGFLAGPLAWVALALYAVLLSWLGSPASAWPFIEYAIFAVLLPFLGYVQWFILLPRWIARLKELRAWPF